MSGSRNVLVGICVFALLGFTVITKGSGVQVPSGTWAATGSLAEARDGAAGVALPDGRVLVVGGETGGQPLASAELYSGGAFSPAAAMHVSRRGASATLLPDGRVLVAGGETLGEGATNSAEIYDPINDSWSYTGSLAEARSGHSATRLEDGRVLIAGGSGASGPLASLETFDPASESFSYAGSLSSPRSGHAAAVLARWPVTNNHLVDRQVIFVGGNDGSSVLSSTEIYDPATGEVSAGPALPGPRQNASAVTVLGGYVYVAGGNDGAQDLASTLLISRDGVVSAAADLLAPRSGHVAVRLRGNNSVLIAGGSGGDSAEIFIPWLNQQVATGSMGGPHSGGIGAAAGPGVYMFAGGSGSSSAELYGYATVDTDKNDYAPGEIVSISGSGWNPGEPVTLLLHEDVTVPNHGDITITVVADEAGNISDSSFAPDEHDLGVRFFLTASDESSGHQARTTFTDALKIGVTRSNPTAATLNRNSGEIFTVQFAISNNNTAGDAGTSLSGNYTLTYSNLTLQSGGPATSASFSGLTAGSPLLLSWSFQAPTGPATGSITLSASITSPSCSSGGGNQCSDSASYTVNVAAPTNTTPAVTANDQAFNEGTSTNYSATWSDPDSGQSHTCTIDFGDGSGAQAGTVAPAQPSTSGTCSASHTYADGPNSYTITVNVSDGIASGSDTATATVNNLAPTVTLSGPSSADEGQTKSYSFTTSDPGQDTFTVVSQSCGANGTLSNPAFNSMTGAGSFDCTFPDGPASSMVSIQVKDSDNANSNTDMITVNIANVAPTVTLSGPSSADEGQTKSYSYTTTDPGTETFSHTASCGANGTLSNDSFNSATGAGSFDCTFPDGPASSTVSITVDDGDGGSDSDSIVVSVANVAPTVTASFASTSVGCGAGNATLNVSFTDPGVDTHTASVNWGDGNTESLGTVTSPFSATHTYASAGMYNAVVTVTDSDGAPGTDGTNAITTNFTILDNGAPGDNFMPPIKPDGTSVFKYKSTIPVKLQVQNCDGSLPSNLTITLQLYLVSGGSPTGDAIVADSTSAADTGNIMRWSAIDQQYIYNLATRPLPDPTATYQLKATIALTGQMVIENFGLKN